MELQVAHIADEVAQDLTDLDLTFLGFEHPSESIRQAFRQRYPEPDALRDLEAWDRFEQEKVEFFERVRQGYLRMASHYPNRYRVADASQPLDAVQKQIRNLLEPELA